MTGVDAQRAVEEEEALLARVQRALSEARARRARVSGPSVQALQSLREEAAAAREEDAAPLLHELAVQHRLGGRALPERVDPASPYVAHLRVREGDVRRDYLLGHATFVDSESDVWVVDWRVAPVAQLFYRYREGDAFEETFPGREVSGVVEVRRVVVVHRGRLVQVVGEGFQARREPDGNWHYSGREGLVAGGAGTAPRPGQLGLGVGAAERGRAPTSPRCSIPSSTRQSAPRETSRSWSWAAPAAGRRPWPCTGWRGSRRRSRSSLHSNAPGWSCPRRGWPVSRRGSSAPLGGGAASVQTLDAAFLDLARRVFGGLPRIVHDPPALVSSLKRHPALHDALHAALSARRSGGAPNWRKLRRELATFLTDRPFLEGVVERAAGRCPGPWSRRRCATRCSSSPIPCGDSWPASTTWSGRPPSTAGRWRRGPTMRWRELWTSRTSRCCSPSAAGGGRCACPRRSHLVLDEAEDFSLFDLTVLAGLFRGSPRTTVAGDEAQQTLASFAGWERSLATLGASGAAWIRLPVSYRCPRPIAELAQSILGSLAPASAPRAAREGAPVGRFAFPGEPQAHLFLAGVLRELVEAEPHAAVAVICHDAATARRFSAVAAELPSSRLVLDGRFTFEPGIDVTDVDSVKGLEFDYVVVPDAVESAWPANDEGRRRLHVAVTRASWQLWLVSTGTPTRLLAPA